MLTLSGWRMPGLQAGKEIQYTTGVRKHVRKCWLKISIFVIACCSWYDFYILSGWLRLGLHIQGWERSEVMSYRSLLIFESLPSMCTSCVAALLAVHTRGAGTKIRPLGRFMSCLCPLSEVVLPLWTLRLSDVCAEMFAEELSWVSAFCVQGSLGSFGSLGHL